MELNEFVFIILWMGVMALFFHFVQVEETMKILGKDEVGTSLWAAVLVVIPIVYIVGSRGNIGDTYNYRKGYEGIPSTFSAMMSYASNIGKDRGFWYFIGFIKVLTKADFRAYFYILAAIQIFSLVQIYRKLSADYIMSIFLFIASTDYISWMCNGVRQFTAVTIIFAGTVWLLEKKYLLYSILILLASTMHRSALIMLPVIYITSGEAWNKKTILLLILTLLIVAYVEVFTNLLDDILEETQYENVVSDWKAWKDDGTNPFRVMVYSVPAVISFFGRKIIRYENNTLINISTNMSIVTAGLYLVSMVTSGIFIGRLPIYTSLFNYILLPWEIKHIFNKKSADIMMIALYVSYLAFYYYQMHVQSGLF
ncbi:MAG: EpsG family protein [Solobacterium sp.]|nr:EpsG family protein [Solobacterium sp.]MBR3358762.1 EpsG family protein [Solobacterium sp.]